LFHNSPNTPEVYEKVINIAVVVGVIPLAVLGVANIFAPHKTFALYGIQPLSVVAFSTVRGVIGACSLVVS
jgi:hypothetical protein